MVEEQFQIDKMANTLKELAAIGKRAREAEARRIAASKQLTSAKSALEVHSRELALLNKQYEESRIAREESEISQSIWRRSQEVSSYRIHLISGEPCPLCGGKEHPWGENFAAIDDAAREQDKRVEQLREQEQRLLESRAQRTSKVEVLADQVHQWTSLGETERVGLERERRAWQERLENLQELHLVEEPASVAAEEWAESRCAAIEARRQDLRCRIRVAQDLQSAANQANGIALARRHDWEQARLAKGEAQRAYQRCQDQKIQLSAQLEATESSMERCIQECAAGLPQTLDWRTRMHHNATEFLAECEERVNEWKTTFEAIERYRRTSRELTILMEAERARGEQEGGRMSANECAQQYELVSVAECWVADQRQTLAGKELLNAMLSRIVEWEAKRKEVLGTLQAAAERLASAKAKQQSTQQTLRQAQENWKIAEERAVEVARSMGLGWEELKNLVATDPKWIEDKTYVVEACQKDMDRWTTLVAERKHQLRLHELRKPPMASKKLAEIAMQEANQAVENSTAQYTQLAGKLQGDDEARRKRKEMEKRIRTQTNTASVYKAVSDLIGSADGKRFRVFAQSLTLESLLYYANQRLRELAPRYQLVRVPGFDLDLQVVDHDLGDEVRSVNSLSGGESFLVSLALALGLSCLSSRDTQVESLLIDEGFGTLDPSTLESALAVLDALQASGRKVGIISHVSRPSGARRCTSRCYSPRGRT